MTDENESRAKEGGSGSLKETGPVHKLERFRSHDTELRLLRWTASTLFGLLVTVVGFQIVRQEDRWDKLNERINKLEQEDSPGQVKATRDLIGKWWVDQVQVFCVTLQGVWRQEEWACYIGEGEKKRVVLKFLPVRLPPEQSPGPPGGQQ